MKYLPKISVIIAVYNAEHYIKESIESIINQSYRNFELILVDDGSNDESVNIIKSYLDDPRVHLIKQMNHGAAIARNNGINISRCEFIAILDSDDIAMPDRLEKQLQFLISNPDYVAVGSNAYVIDKEGELIYNSSLEETDIELKNKLPEMPFFHPSLMFRKNAFLDAGKYPDGMRVGQDVIMVNKLSNYGKFFNLKESLIKYRIVPTANSIHGSKVSKKVNLIFKNVIKGVRLTVEDLKVLEDITSNINLKRRIANYHLFLAKKFLKNNYEPKISRKNSILSLKKHLTSQAMLIYFISFLPKFIIKRL